MWNLRESSAFAHTTLKNLGKGGVVFPLQQLAFCFDRKQIFLTANHSMSQYQKISYDCHFYQMTVDSGTISCFDEGINTIPPHPVTKKKEEINKDSTEYKFYLQDVKFHFWCHTLNTYMAPLLAKCAKAKEAL